MTIEKCKTEGCENIARYVYCKSCGGRKRAEDEGLLVSKQTQGEARNKLQGRGMIPKGQAIAHGQGLSQFLPPEEVARRKAEKLTKRTVREAKRGALRAERLAAQPKKGKSDGSGKNQHKKKGGDKKKKK